MPACVDEADDESREVVVSERVDPRHLGGLTSQQRAARLAARTGHAFDELREHLWVELPGREVVEEEKRLCALAQNVVDAVVDNVPAEVGEVAGHRRDLRLGADAVDRRHDERVVHSGEHSLKKCAKAADSADDIIVSGSLDFGADPSQSATSLVDVDTRRSIGQFVAHPNQSTPAGAVLVPRGGVSSSGWVCSSAVEQWPFKPLVEGSNPSGPTNF